MPIRRSVFAMSALALLVGCSDAGSSATHPAGVPAIPQGNIAGTQSVGACACTPAFGEHAQRRRARAAAPAHSSGDPGTRRTSSTSPPRSTRPSPEVKGIKLVMGGLPLQVDTKTPFRARTAPKMGSSAQAKTTS